MSASVDERMEARLALRTPALVCAIVLGVLADLLVRGSGRPGLGVTLWASAGVVALAVLLRGRAGAASVETRWMVGGALAFACTLVLRDADALAAFSLLAAVALLTLAAGRATAAWVTRGHLSDVVFAALRVGVLCALGPLGWGRGTPDAGERAGGWTRSAQTMLRGTLMALPALVLLAALLMNADPVFERVVLDVLHIDVELVVQHAVFAVFIAWATAGFLRSFLLHDDTVMSRLRVPQPAFAAAEVSVALWILNVLFVAFIAVQLRYLYGGANLVQITPGLTYAAYARRGFFELVTTTALVVPILLAADWAAAPDTRRARLMLKMSMLVLLVLQIGVIASAAFRMKLYQDAYGLTEERLYVSVIIVWLITVLSWLALTVLRGRRERFMIGSVVAAVACVVALYIMNPHALIARVNIDRATPGGEYDGAYLQGLSADAVPTLLARLDKLPEPERCRVARTIKARWSGERKGGWRSWNLSDWRARGLVAAQAATLRCPG